MENSDFDNSSNQTYENDNVSSSVGHRYYIAHEVIFNIFCIIAICADIAIIYTFFRFKRLRTVANIFLANWAIADLCSLIVTPAGYGLSSIFHLLSLSEVVSCTIFEVGSILHTNLIVFVLLVAADWCLAAYFARSSAIFRKNYKYIIVALWVPTLAFCCFCTGYCMNSYYSMLPHFVALAAVCAILLTVIVLQTTRNVQKCRKKPLEYPTQRLSLVTAFVICYLLAFIKVLFMYHVVGHPLLGTIAACVVFSNSLVNLAMLYRYDKDFQACFLQAIRRNGGQYEESLTDDFDALDRDFNGKSSSVQVSFHNPTEELLTNAY